MKILFLVPYPLGQAPSQRFRFEQYFSFLTQNGIAFETQSFLSQKTWKILYKKGFFAQKIVGILAGFIRRLLILFSLHKFDFVFIHRETSPIFPPIFEFVIAKIFQKK
ncbi:MAG: glycosyltransferase family 1 protein, partial [Bacteroidetes bacterium]